MGQQGVNDLFAVPKPHSEVQLIHTFSYWRAKAGPTDQKAMIGMNVMDAADQSLKRRLVHHYAAGLDLNDKLGAAQAEGALAGDDVDAAIRPGWRDLDLISLSS